MRNLQVLINQSRNLFLQHPVYYELVVCSADDKVITAGRRSNGDKVTSYFIRLLIVTGHKVEPSFMNCNENDDMKIKSNNTQFLRAVEGCTRGAGGAMTCSRRYERACSISHNHLFSLASHPTDLIGRVYCAATGAWKNLIHFVERLYLKNII